ERDWNHPSIVVQSVVNEGWGVDLAHKEETRRWLRAAFDRAKELTAPLGRLVVDNSACCDNFHLRTDITDNHRYNTIPDEYQPFDSWVADFASRPKWNFSPFGDADETGREPLVSPSSATGVCRGCRKICRGGSSAVLASAPSRARRACSNASRSSSSARSSATTTRWPRRPSGTSLSRSSTRSRRF